MNPPTPHATAVQFGLRVREEAARAGGDKWSAARAIADTFPTLSSDKRTFLAWALVQAEALAFQIDRPVAGDRQGAYVAHHALAARHGLVAARETDGGGGGHGHAAPQESPAPRTPVRSFFQNNPGAYLVKIGNTGACKPVRDLTRADITTIYRYFERSESTYREKREGWQRIAERVPQDGTLGGVLPDLPTRDRAFLYGEIGLRVEEGAA